MPLNRIAVLLGESVAAVIVLAVGFLAEASEAMGQWSPLINLGAIGCVLLWFILRAEPRMVAIEAAINRGVRMTGLTIIAMKGASPAVKDQARDILSELEHKKK